MKGARMSTHVSAEAPAPSFVSTLGNLLIAPREAFAGIMRRPSPWLPFVLYVVLQLAFTAVWTSKLDIMAFVTAQAEEAGRPAPPAQALPFIKGMFWAGPLVFIPIFFFGMALGLWVIYRFFYGTDLTYKIALTVCAWTSLITSIVTMPLILLTMVLKGDWQVDPRTALAANLGAFLDKATTAKPLLALAGHIDLVSIWVVFLLATGFAVAIKKPTGSAMWGVVVPWLVIVLLSVGWAAIF
jgi:hypothetical protein